MRKLQFLCLNNKNSSDAMQVLMVYDNGDFALIAVTRQGVICKAFSTYKVLDRGGWMDRGWETVIEL